MGKRLNALLGRSSKASKLKKLANLAVSRIAILTNLHRVRCSQARSDVIQLLRLGYHQRALLRVEQVIKEQNALDALVMIENYCHLVAERSELIANSREWESPADLKEAASTLIFAASRTGEFPELHEIRRVLTSKYGKDFAYNAVELRNEEMRRLQLKTRSSHQLMQPSNYLETAHGTNTGMIMVLPIFNILKFK